MRNPFVSQATRRGAPGEATLAGSEIVSGWQVANSLVPEGMPESNKVWYADVTFFPRCVWAIASNGVITRLKLARTPNWTESNPDDPMSEWWYWQNPNWWQNPNPHKTTNSSGTVMHLGVDTTHITQPGSYYSNALVWTEWGIVMGTPFPSTVEVVDLAQKGLGFQGVWYNDSETIMRGCRYYLEDKPHYLDQAGEFHAETRPGGARIFLRMPGDMPPTNFVIEAASRVAMIDLTSASNVKISGLTFAFGNVYRDLTARFFVHADVLASAIRLRGTGTNLTINNCKFQHLNMAVRFKAAADTDRLDQIRILDNEILETDHGGIDISDSSRWGKFTGAFGPLGQVEVLRNRLHNIGQRPARSEWGHALVVQFPSSAVVAGNVLTRAHGAGLFLFGGKGDSESRDKPFARMLVFNNKVEGSLLKANDWGGIEVWQGGPNYVFNNISANPRGFWHWTWLDKNSTDKTNSSAGWGHAYYLDGSFKNYLFNNVAWGQPGTMQHPWSATAFQIVLGIHNQLFNNTAYSLMEMSRRQGMQGGRNHYLGNIFMDFPFAGFNGEASQGQTATDLSIETLAFSSNVFSGRLPTKFASFEQSGQIYNSPAAFSTALRAYQPYAADVGQQVAGPVVSNAAVADFRLPPNSPAVDRGAKVFVPWALARNVGEWHFRRLPVNPAVVEDDHWYMASYYTKRGEYWKVPRFPLQGFGISSNDFVAGPLEDWCAGALRLNGANQYLVCSNSEMKKSFTYTLVNNDFSEVPTTISGDQIWSPDIATEGFVLEAVLKCAAGSSGLVVGKDNGANGWKLELGPQGRPVVSLRVGGSLVSSFLADASAADSAWHHLLVEVTREMVNGIRLWLDGQPANGVFTGTTPVASLANNADLYVGGGPGQAFLACELEFLRVARGTLQEAWTTAEELYAWEFSGPFLRDYFGASPNGARRDAGAMESARLFATNGVPVAWLAGYGLTNASPDAEALADQDGDGEPAWHEYYAGTDPTQPGSTFRIVSIAPAAGGHEIRWLGGTNGYSGPFVVEACTNGLGSSWFSASGPIPRSATGSNSWLAPATRAQALYRIRVSY